MHSEALLPDDLVAIHGHRFAPMRQQRGQQLRERATIVDAQPHEISGIVADRTLRRTHLMFDGSGSLTSDCSCLGPALCEHAYALLLAFDQRRAARDAGPAARRAQPPARRRRGEGATQPDPPPVRPQPPPDWRHRLQSVHAARGAPLPPWVQTLPVYLVDLEATRKHGRLALHVMMPERRGAEEWLAAADLGTDPATLPEHDRQLCQLLHAAGRNYGPPVLQPRCSVPGSWLPVVLPLLLATGRAQQVDSLRNQRIAPVPLRLDGGGPFAFTSELRRAEDGLAVHGRIFRGGESYEHPEVLAVLDGGFAIVDDRVVLLPLGPGAAFARTLLHEGPLAAPGDEEAELLAAVVDATDACPEFAPPLPTRSAGAPVPVLLVRMAQAMPQHVPVELQFDYGERRAEVDGPALLQPPEPDGTWLRRDAAAERELWERVLALGGDAIEPTALPGCYVLHRKHLARHLGTFVAGGFRVFADGVPLRRSVAWKASVTTGIDWFDVRGELEFEGGGRLPLGAALAALRAGEHLVELGDGTTAVLPEEWVAHWAPLLELGEHQDGRLRLRRSQALLLDLLLAARAGEVAADAGFAAWRQRLQGFRGVAPAGEPEGFLGTLRPYQRLGLGWLCFLRELGLGGCLADDMGLGKTVQVLALLLLVHGQARARLPSLLVAPRSLLDNWRREAARFAPSLRVLDFSGPDRWQRLAAAGGWSRFDLVLSTYGTVRLDVGRFEEQGAFEYAILDEAQATGNESSLTSKAVRLLRASHRLALTGTPVQNHVGELWALFEFLNPGLLGRSRTFKRLLGQGNARGHGLDLGLLQSALAPFLLRRTKEEVLPDLPDKQQQDLLCDLEGSQRAAYDALRDAYRERLLRGTGPLAARERFVALEALLRLRQAACHEGLLDGRHAQKGSAKLDALLPMLQEIAASGHKALVFSQFTQFLAIVKRRLDDLAIPYEYLDGRTQKRQQRADRFQQDPRCPLFLISLKAGGFGLNLTAADYVFLLDPWWNPAAEAQAIDRAHRIGREGKVLAYRLIARNTVEEKVLALQAEKRALVEAVLGADKSLLGKLTREDLAALLA